MHEKLSVSTSLEELYMVSHSGCQGTRKFSDTLPLLSRFRIHLSPVLPFSCTLEKAVQDLCIHKMADRLYQKLQQVRLTRCDVPACPPIQECDSHIGLQVTALSGVLQLDAVAFLDRVDATWRDHCRFEHVSFHSVQHDCDLP